MIDDNKNYPESKMCNQCGSDKSLQDFSPHKEGKYGRQSKCKICMNENKKKYNETSEGKSKNRARAKKWADENVERNRDRANKWRDDNLELARENDRKRHGEHRREQKRKSYKKNPEIYKKRAAEWRKKNPSKRIAISHNYRARKQSLPNTLTARDWELCLLYWGCCAACGRIEEVYHADHWIPLTNRRCPGTVVENIIPLCHSCNSSKNSSEALQWLKRQFPENFSVIRRDIRFYFELAVGGVYS